MAKEVATCTLALHITLKSTSLLQVKILSAIFSFCVDNAVTITALVKINSAKCSAIQRQLGLVATFYHKLIHAAIRYHGPPAFFFQPVMFIFFEQISLHILQKTLFLVAWFCGGSSAKHLFRRQVQYSSPGGFDNMCTGLKIPCGSRGS